jgi:type II secretory pathway component PulF
MGRYHVADLRQASLYPAIVLTVVMGFVLFLFSFIIPKFAILLASTNAELPLVTKIIFGASDFAKKKLVDVGGGSVPPDP